MLTIIDYISFSIPVTQPEDNDHTGWWDEVGREIVAIEDLSAIWKGNDKLVPAIAMKPYNRAWRTEDGTVMVHGSALLPHVTVQISGGGCARVAANHDTYIVLDAVKERITRLDIANDIETDTRPSEFMAARRETRIKTTGFIKSPTGETATVGSRQSEKYCRCYVYDEPHPRAGVLRIEFELKGDTAKMAARAILQNSVNDLSGTLGEDFGLNHPIWQPDDFTTVELRPDTPERRTTPKLTWLNTQVAPTIKKLHEDGAFDARAWVNQILKD